jgi:flagellar FliL protein
MTDVAPPAKAPRGRRWLLIAGLVAVVFILGAAAGVVAGRFVGQDGPASDGASEEEAPHPEEPGTRRELEVGRITVVIPANHARGGTLHLLITPLVVGHSPGDEAEAGHGEKEDSAPGPVPELRDAFIEYLSQLQEPEVRGSLGLVTMRSELLRRARAVAPELNASAVLIQEYVIQ